MRAACAVLIVMACGGCAEPIDAPLSPELGKAVASMDAQIIPARQVDAPPTSSATQGVRAIERFERGPQTDRSATPPSDAYSLQAGGAQGDTAAPPQQGENR